VKPEGDEAVSYVVGPQGTILTTADLPSTNIRRWTIFRKAEIITAVRGGLLSLEDACKRYSLTVEEFISWKSPDKRDCAPRCARFAYTVTTTKLLTADSNQNRIRSTPSR
jgi:Protein of unknown function (DUF1153)